MILFIGDGMGFEHVSAGGHFLHGQPGTLVFESFPHQAQVTTYSASHLITDSAASASAMATGFKVSNGVISMGNDGQELETLLEAASRRGQSTGLVTTSFLTDATPAAFAAHAADRTHFADIANDYLTQTRPNVLMGGGDPEEGWHAAAAAGADYPVVTNRSELLSVDTEAIDRLAGVFGEGWMLPDEREEFDLPSLPEMTTAALQILDNNPEGFFLMVEGGLIDVAAHSNFIEGVVSEVAEFDQAVQAALDWAGSRSNLTILVLADHETGGLTVVQGNGAGETPSVTWSTTNHTAANVPAYAWGLHAERVSDLIDNTGIPDIVASDVIVEPPDPPDPSPEPTASTVVPTEIPVEPTKTPDDPPYLVFLPQVVR